MKLYIETYGCRMNICDSQTIYSILSSDYTFCSSIHQSDIVIFNCCSVREIGHEKIFSRLNELKELGLHNKKIIIAGCLATQLDKKIFDVFPFIDLVIGPNSYRELPLLLKSDAHHMISNDNNVTDMYADVVPLRYIEDKTTAAVTIMKGCNQFCSYCIEPYTRGKESSRDRESIIEECKRIQDLHYRELTLVGHIIDRYASGFANLLNEIAQKCPNLRIKFLSSHPLTFTDEIAKVILNNKNIMRVIHLPIQSGSDDILARMNRGYTMYDFKQLISHIRKMIPDIHIITDIMTGFCGETEEDFHKTLNTVEELMFDDINVFCFSMRNHTKASYLYKDDIPTEIKWNRYKKVIALRDKIKLMKNSNRIGETIMVYNEGEWSMNPKYYFGRDHYLQNIVFHPNMELSINDPVFIKIVSVDANVLYGEIIPS